MTKNLALLSAPLLLALAACGGSSSTSSTPAGSAASAAATASQSTAAATAAASASASGQSTPSTVATSGTVSARSGDFTVTLPAGVSQLSDSKTDLALATDAQSRVLFSKLTGKTVAQARAGAAQECASPQGTSKVTSTHPPAMGGEQAVGCVVDAAKGRATLAVVAHNNTPYAYLALIAKKGAAADAERDAVLQAVHWTK